MSATNCPPPPLFQHRRHPNPPPMMVNKNIKCLTPSCNGITPETSYKPALSFFLDNNSQQHRRDQPVVGGILKHRLPPSHLSPSIIPAYVNFQGRVTMECNNAHHSRDYQEWMERKCSNSSSKSICSGSRREPNHHHHHTLPSIHIQQQQPPPLIKKKVTFRPTCTVAFDTRRRDPVVIVGNNNKNANNVDAEDRKKALYYTKSELNAMYRETQATCTLSRELLSPEQYSLAKAAREDAIFAPSSLRGLELIIYPTRRKNKYLAIRSFLKYQELLNSENVHHSDDDDVLPSVEEKALALAEASANLTAWSSLVAAETGRRDALAARAAAYPDGDGVEADNYFPAVAPNRNVSAAPIIEHGVPVQLLRKTHTTVATASPPPPTATTTANHHPTKHPKQERRWSRRVTMEGEEHEERRLLLKKRKIMM